MKFEIKDIWNWRNLRVLKIEDDEIWSRRKLKSKSLKVIKFEVEVWSLNLKVEEIMVEERWSWSIWRNSRVKKMGEN